MLSGTEHCTPKNFCEILPNFPVNFLVRFRFASKPSFYWVVPSSRSGKLFGAVRATFASFSRFFLVFDMHVFVANVFVGCFGGVGGCSGFLGHTLWCGVRMRLPQCTQSSE